MKKLKLGVLGCGGAALSIHLPVLHCLRDKYELVAVCDQSFNRALQTAKKYGIRKTFSSFEEMLQESFDVLVILTLNHENAIDKGLEARKHIFTEKPISLDLEASYALCEKAKMAGLTINVGLMRFYDPIIMQLNQMLIANSTDSAFFYKYDGSDACFRELLFPVNMDVYTFGTSEPPKVPLAFNKEQLFALKTLLWSGVHQLSAMLCLFEELEPIYCLIDKKFSALSCLFKTRSGKLIVLNILETSLSLYEEKILLFGKTQKVECCFSSPYLNISQSTLSITREENKNISLQRASFYETAFQIMWKEAYDSFSREENLSSLFALKVEKLARKTAKMAISVQSLDLPSLADSEASRSV